MPNTKREESTKTFIEELRQLPPAERAQRLAQEAVGNLQKVANRQRAPQSPAKK